MTVQKQSITDVSEGRGVMGESQRMAVLTEIVLYCGFIKIVPPGKMRCSRETSKLKGKIFLPVKIRCSNRK